MPPRESRATGTREALLIAAKRVVSRLGVKRLTLDMVAVEANVSKGGVLYHFPTMNTLIIAMMETDMERWQSKMEAYQVEEAERGELPEAGRFVRAMVASLAGHCPIELTPDDPTGHSQPDILHPGVPPEVRSGMFAAVAGDQQLLQRLRDKFARVQTRVEQDGIDPVMATLVRLAADGLLFTEMLGLASPQGEFRQQIADRLIALASPPQEPESK